jgi:phosphoribosylanthranilate isomerase
MKICGVTTAADAAMIANAGADAIGLNFYPGSKRYVAPEHAQAIAHDLAPTVCRVGVFVNSDSDEVHRIAEQVGLDLVQVHGDEPPEFLAELAGLGIIRAFRCHADLANIQDYLSSCSKLPDAVLLDAFDPRAFGGTGKTLDWPRLAGAVTTLRVPVILAGGLTPANVARAISEARPSAVDTASGVETGHPGRKDRQLTEAFVQAAKLAFSA